ncbi:hypothetical protein OTU49_010974 [Cherax quadricarinatus]|uniref:SWIM-type domain-containing protein n=2 Tax=Cherax quadricarinatus TaxID=27406 RepID=A0AAW0W631_CHEQU|nr:zinc finger SWIM domain-containing protein 7-like isoform X2 [Cherax quadricarinatus]XP_053655521.1 zinc finger SWIM domain-containing protein 7-like isoform X2 [Cherax quadricarinatus]
MNKCPDVAAVLEGLLQVVKVEYQSSGQLSSEVLHSLHLLHGQSLLNALDLIDSKKVTKVISSSGRWVYQVTGSSGTPYVCLPNSIFCQCPAFKYAVVKRRDSVMCKHVLAAHLSTAMGTNEEKNVSDEYIMDILAHMD